ncbi:tyrocidine synthase 3 [Kordia sp. SMS9]|uniref:non-ribosomal peptide synthetase n=1 Tax=Kordia sp. SMS9 TaxID=2282170 RepID=UPI000E0DABA0|nr:non-ribosomal peptide synthetase [Kordia sp. SMS9]AXG70735.1 tyrocidine synthase 3 [Kordia sp. SMS9]
MKELLQKLNALQIVVTLNGDTLDVKAPKGAMTKALLIELKAHKEALIDFLKAYQVTPAIPKAAAQESYVLSSSQYRIWLLQQLEKNNAAYNMPSAFSVEGIIDKKLLEKAFELLVKRYEILRTNFKWCAKRNMPVQIVNDATAKSFSYTYMDLSDEKSNQSRIAQEIKAEVAYNFDLENDPLLRITLLKTGTNTHVLVFVVHHIISDGGSSAIIVNDVFEYYRALVSKQEITLPTLEIQYKDYAVWEQQQLQTPAMEVHKNYWTSIFKQTTTAVELPTSFSRPSKKTYNGHCIAKHIPTQHFETLCKAEGATLFMGITALLNALFYKYTGSTQITIGSPIDGRTEAELESQVGFFVNTFGIQTNFAKEHTFAALLQQVKRKTLEAFQHQHYPFDALINDLGISDRSRNPLFDVIVSIVPSETASLQKEQAVNVTEISLGDTTSKFDLEFVWHVNATETELRLTYNTDIYSADFIQQMLGHIETLLQNIVANSNASLQELQYVSSQEKNKLLHEFNTPILEVKTTGTYIHVFQKELENNKENVAVVEDGKTTTYAQLNEEATKLASYLRDHHDINAKEFVAVQLPRSKSLLVAFLAIQKLGAVYVPIDANYPQERIDFIIVDSQAKCIIDKSFLEKFFTAKIDTVSDIIPETNAQDLAYMIYTSGSTGTPKGVMISHENLINLCHWHIDYYAVSAASHATLYAGIGFDASLWEMCPYLLAGATLHAVEKQETRINIEALANFLKTHKITHTYLPTAVCQEFVMQNVSLSHLKILTGGDTLHLKNAPKFTLYNNYGPTENTVVTTAYPIVNHALTSPIPIGKPIHNTQVYILDKNLDIVPVGIPGELYIAGKGVAKGYWNRPKLTKERFVENPFLLGEKMYATGDLVKWLPNGEILFLGRKDNQIQLRGYRVELGEIEAAIANSFQQIQQVTVLEKEGQLVTFFTSEDALDSENIKKALQKTVPAYMVPNSFTRLETVPLTPNGKVDRKYLQQLSIAKTQDKPLVAAKTDIEKELVTIWKKVLNLTEVSVEDDFFELGGHSLMLMKLMVNYQETFQISLDLSSLYAHTQLIQHAKLLSLKKQQHIEIPSLEEQAHYEVSSTQLRYWLIDKVKGKSKEFNITNTFALPKQIDSILLEKAVSKLVARHETLRTTFVDVAGIPKQKIHKTNSVTLQHFTSEANAQQYAFDHIFDLTQYPLYKIAITDTKLYFNIHHSICDGWSVHILYRDLMKLYEEAQHQTAANLPKLTIQYKEYAAWQNQREQTEEFAYQKHYWEEQLKGPRAYIQLPTDFPETIQSKASVCKIVIEKELQQQIVNNATQHNVSTFTTFLAAFKILIYKLSYERDSIVGIPVANRAHYQINNLAGCFLNTLMLRDTIDEQLSIKDWIQQVHNTLTEGLTHQSYPFENVLETLEITQKDKFPLSPVFLNMVDFDATEETIDATGMEFESTALPPKFDLECYVKSFANGYTIDCVYDDQLFSQETITLWMRSYVDMLQQMVNNDAKSIASVTTFENVPKFTQELPQRTFTRFEAEEIDQTVAQRFEKQVKLHADAIAVTANDQQFTYQTINNYANQVAKKITEQEQDTKRIALLVSHNENTVIGMLGVLKSGHAYVPIDVENPIQRIQFILKDAACNILVYDAAVEHKILQLKELFPSLLFINLSDTLQDGIALENPVNKSVPTDEAYVLYTSGSTGNPKGVVQTQRNMLHYIRVYTNNVAISTTDNLSVFSTYSFDASIKDIYGAILNGATVRFYAIPEKGLADLGDWIMEENVSIIHMVPTIYRYFIGTLPENKVLHTVRLVDLGGEASYASDFELFKKHFPTHAYLVNDYGPTEATIVSQHFLKQTTHIHKSSLHLGSAVTETEIYIVDAHGKEAAVYEEGEIVFKSPYISKGYLNLAEKTNAVFTQDTENPELYSYRSGDIGKRFPDGTIVYLGRKDTQVKINGYRIELSEIGLQIAELESITKAEVLVQTLDAKEYITCYYTGEHKENAVFKAALKDRLPGYMIPSVYVQLASFPLTRTGKIDRKALPALTEEVIKTEAYKAPENDIQQCLVAIWSAQLNIASEQLGIKDNFFEIGGNSLQSVTIINTINKTFDIALSIEDLYESLNIQDLSKVIHFATLQKRQSEATSEDMDEIML